MDKDIRIRCFIAIPVPDPVKSALVSCQQAMRSQIAGTADTRWVKPAAMHLTLKFLGDIPRTKVPHISLCLDQAADGVTPFPLIPGGFGVFPTVQRPRVIWVGFQEASAPLSIITRRLDDALSKLGFPKERGPYVPHLTLARIKKLHTAEKSGNIIEIIQANDIPSFTVERIVLYQSELQPRGAVHTGLYETILTD